MEHQAGRVSITSVVPLHWSSVLGDPQTAALALQSLKSAAAGAAVVPSHPAG